MAWILICDIGEDIGEYSDRMNYAIGIYGDEKKAQAEVERLTAQDNIGQEKIRSIRDTKPYLSRHQDLRLTQLYNQRTKIMRDLISNLTPSDFMGSDEVRFYLQEAPVISEI